MCLYSTVGMIVTGETRSTWREPGLSASLSTAYPTCLWSESIQVFAERHRSSSPWATARPVWNVLQF